MGLRITTSLDIRGLDGDDIARRVRQSVSEMPAGDLIEILASVPCRTIHEAAWRAANGVDLLESSRLGAVFRIVLRKRADAPSR